MKCNSCGVLCKCKAVPVEKGAAQHLRLIDSALGNISRLIKKATIKPREYESNILHYLREIDSRVQTLRKEIR